ncbi:PREDICTED: uncharacterized protein LOC108771500 [Cyphomyrmex costatus]|uniref:uncharacterized protein LOC108771500 n=1 Tax=Cyphomyrmex costatus TaxID=456900 RepID=UPI0008523120|nr:PREDICTED: uncharacterized protein LOC108771500 [Cyphomyrmex costatus]
MSKEIVKTVHCYPICNPNTFINYALTESLDTLPVCEEKLLSFTAPPIQSWSIVSCFMELPVTVKEELAVKDAYSLLRAWTSSVTMKRLLCTSSAINGLAIWVKRVLPWGQYYAYIQQQ